MSHNNIKLIPKRILDGISTLCKDVLKIFLATCGTAKPINAIGPQKAVEAPANIPTEAIVNNLVLSIETPKDLAYDSPIKKAFNDFETPKAKINPKVKDHHKKDLEIRILQMMQHLLRLDKPTKRKRTRESYNLKK